MTSYVIKSARFLLHRASVYYQIKAISQLSGDLRPGLFKGIVISRDTRKVWTGSRRDDCGRCASRRTGAGLV